MKHSSPKVNNATKGPTVNTGTLVGHVLRKAVQHTKNPVVEAIFEEMGPEIDGILQEHLSGHEVDLAVMQNGLNRVGRVIQRVSNARKTA
jgi:hypothetical protein